MSKQAHKRVRAARGLLQACAVPAVMQQRLKILVQAVIIIHDPNRGQGHLGDAVVHKTGTDSLSELASGSGSGLVQDAGKGRILDGGQGQSLTFCGTGVGAAGRCGPSRPCWAASAAAAGRTAAAARSR